MVFGGWSLCICEPMKCKRYCLDPDHIWVPIKIGEDWNHCVAHDYDGCAFRDHTSEISVNLLSNQNNIVLIYHNVVKLITLLHAYVGFWGENDYLNFLLSREGTCRCNIDHDYI